MANIFFSSDWHLSHAAAIFTFKRFDGSPLRNFSSVEEMDEHMIEKHNSIVKSSDHFYFLGDVTMKRQYLPLVSRFNGHKRLVRGNHDIFKTAEYLKYFDEIYGTRYLDGIIFSHYPIHHDSLGKNKFNAHGHFHANPSPVGPYINLSVEMLDDYTPISLEDLKLRIKKIQDLGS